MRLRRPGRCGRSDGPGGTGERACRRWSGGFSRPGTSERSTLSAESRPFFQRRAAFAACGRLLRNGRAAGATESRCWPERCIARRTLLGWFRNPIGRHQLLAALPASSRRPDQQLRYERLQFGGHQALSSGNRRPRRPTPRPRCRQRPQSTGPGRTKEGRTSRTCTRLYWLQRSRTGRSCRCGTRFRSRRCPASSWSRCNSQRNPANPAAT